MASIRKILQQRTSRVSRQKAHAVYFDRKGFLCQQCGEELSREGLVPLELVNCAKCQTPNLVPLLLDDEFLLTEPIGAGGLASAYKALWRQEPGREIAVKVLMEDKMSTLDFIEDFQQESAIHSLIPSHPNVVDYISHGYANARHYHAMELIPGQRLLSRVEHKGKLPESETLQVLIQVLNGLVHIHQNGVLYRDLNAGNILVDDTGNAVLIDFGLSMTIEDALKIHGKPKHVDGTMEYIPPERLYGEPEDQRSIIYSQGLLLYYLLTAETFMKGTDARRTAIKHVAPLRLAQAPSMPADISEATVALIESMIQTDPGDRFATLEEARTAMIDALNLLLS